MTTRHHIRNPLEWALDQVKFSSEALESTARSVIGRDTNRYRAPPVVRRIELHDLRDIIIKGIADTGAYRTDVIFLCLVYPIIGLILMRMTFHFEMLPLLFPLAAGFALVGSAAAVGLYEMSRRRERALKTNWVDAFSIVESRGFGAIVVLGLVLTFIFLLWMLSAHVIYEATLGPEQPNSVGTFAVDVITTPSGWIMIGLGLGVGFLFAVLALSISVVSFPLLLDREVGLIVAVSTSIRAVIMNPVPMAVWGTIVAASLFLGSLPLLLGLVIVLPVLGHSTWHLYRKLVTHRPQNETL